MPAGAGKCKSCNDRALTEPLQKVRNGQSLLSMSREYDIPTGTPCNKINKKHMGKAGGATVFSDREEQEMWTTSSKLQSGVSDGLPGYEDAGQECAGKARKKEKWFSNNIPSQ